MNEPREVIELEEDRAFVEGQMTIRGSASGAEVTGPPFGQIIEFRDGLIARVEQYGEVSEARRAADLPET